MDSQLTLVQPPTPTVALAQAPSTASIILDLSSSVITSTTLVLRGAPDVCYTVETRAMAGLMGIRMELIIRARYERVLATIRRGNVLADQITFEGQQGPMKLAQWLRWPRTGLFPVTFEEDDTIYAWNLDGDRIVLSKGTTPDAPHIAWFTPSRFHRTPLSSNSTVTAASLALTPTADDIRHYVLISCILVVQRMRRPDGRDAYTRGVFAAYAPGGGTRA